MRRFIGGVRAVLVTAAVLAVELLAVGCEDNGANSSNNCGTDGTANSCKSVTIGGQTWLAENLNYQTEDSWCYGNSTANCDKYGRLYKWEAAKRACQLIGWRLPSGEDWDKLASAAGGSSTAAIKLKSRSGWYDKGNGSDFYGFSALPGGARGSDGDFYDAGKSGYWWTDTESNSDHAYLRRMKYNNDDVDEKNDGQSYGFSVRCVADP